jgi:uncharacterized sulfatase
MVLPPFWPDAPIVREELARYYDLVTSVDYDVGDVSPTSTETVSLKTPSSSCSAIMDAACRATNAGSTTPALHVPLIVRWPGKVKAGAVRDDLVEFLDLPATALALGTGNVPADLEGQAMLTKEGAAPAEPRKFVHAHRDYMDEVLDRIRSVRDGRFRYIRNFMPELPYSQRITYMEIGKTMQTWREWHAAGNSTQCSPCFFADKKPTEELYDCEADPFEVKNLIDDPQHAAKLAELRTEMDRWLKATNDMAGRMTAEEMVEKGIIRKRNETYEARKKAGTL